MYTTLDVSDVSNKEKSLKLLLWLGIGSMIMLFAGLTSAYVVRRLENDWISFELPSFFYVSTGVILLSSISMNIAIKYLRNDKLSGGFWFLAVTLILGLVFVITQIMGWGVLKNADIFFSGNNVAASFLYVLTGLHLAHIVGGIISVLVTTVSAKQGKYYSGNVLGAELCATFWHFLGVLWVYLFLFLLFIR